MKTIGISSREVSIPAEARARSCPAWRYQGSSIWSGRRNRRRGTLPPTRTPGIDSRTPLAGRVRLAHRLVVIDHGHKWNLDGALFLAGPHGFRIRHFWGERPLSFGIGFATDISGMESGAGALSSPSGFQDRFAQQIQAASVRSDERISRLPSLAVALWGSRGMENENAAPGPSFNVAQRRP